MELPFATLDVFTSTRLEGNPLAVVTVPRALKGELSQAAKLKIAQEFNLSETVFLHEAAADAAGGESRTVDIFTTGREIPFAGHPTIGTAVYCLHHESEGSGSDGGAGSGSLKTLVTKAGPIPITSSASRVVSAQIPHNVRIHANTLGDVLSSRSSPSSSSKPLPAAGGTAWVVPAQPAEQPAVSGLSSDPTIRAAELAAPVVSIVNGMTFLLVRLDSLEALGKVEVAALDYDKLSPGKGGEEKHLLDEGWRDSLVARYYYVDVPSSAASSVMAGDRVDAEAVRNLRTRMIEFNMEDPATGSAASALACYLSLTADDQGCERRKFVMTQGVEMGRKSVISLETTTTRKEGSGDVAIGEVHLGGTAVVVMKGVLAV
ncbi:hypothetical protein Micbo1qcDRAFT_230540 [Microdochium bolleyi]|uniref:Phenazine biosynthesis-like protein n=1 Tax=Microdochium bolleyi TaxID=196109 RepID=A0A136JDP0_9PEZI|nr:hypothetical protein Micbo1qcDRAFT_230540 [Microdochium bolleyi]